MQLKLFLMIFTVGVSISSMAQAISIPNLSSQQLQRIARDVTPTRSQEFFREGQAQLEREIQRLEREKRDPILKVDPAVEPRNQPLPRVMPKVRQDGQY